MIPEEIDGDSIEMSFYQIYNGFLAIYQVLSSENWVNVLYAATGSSTGRFQIFVAALFIAGWFLFANCAYIISEQLQFAAKNATASYSHPNVYRCHKRRLCGSGGGKA